MVLTLLAIDVAALAGFAALAVIVPPGSMRVGSLGSAALCGAGTLLVVWAQFVGGEPATQVLPIGPPGMAMRFVLDPLSACFLMAVFIVGAPCAVFADAERNVSRLSRCALPAALAAMTVMVLAADALTLVLGLGLLGFAGWAGHSRAQEAHNGVGCLRMAALGVVCLIAVFAVAGFTDYAAMRVAPPTGWQADVVFILALLGAGVPIALSSHDVWARRPASTTPSHMNAFSGAAGMAIGVYLLIRLVFDLCGPSQPAWWSVPLLIVGAILTVFGALRATLESDLDAGLLIGSLQQVGLAIIGLAVAHIARTVDLPLLAELAFGATWLQMAGLVVCRTLLLLCAAAAQDGAGTHQLDRWAD